MTAASVIHNLISAKAQTPLFLNNHDSGSIRKF